MRLKVKRIFTKLKDTLFNCDHQKYGDIVASLKISKITLTFKTSNNETFQSFEYLIISLKFI